MDKENVGEVKLRKTSNVRKEVHLNNLLGYVVESIPQAAQNLLAFKYIVMLMV